MTVKMIVTDLDRTLLKTDKSISPYTANVLSRCRQNGIRIVFATARPRRTVVHFFESAPADALILHNGAVIYINNDLLHHCGIKPNINKNILLSICRDYPNVNMSVEIEDVLYANFDVSYVWSNTQAKRTDFTDLPDKPADKIIVRVSSMEDIERFRKYLSDDLYIEMNEGKLGLIMHKNATKWNGIKALAQHLNIYTEEVAAFGDDYNDVEMLKNCGVGVAVGNALDEAKAAAGYICGINDEDGVASWISRYIL